MSLEQVYWIGGIIGAIVAVIALFRKITARPTLSNQQDANVVGQSNSVNQNSTTTMDGQSNYK